MNDDTLPREITLTTLFSLQILLLGVAIFLFVILDYQLNLNGRLGFIALLAGAACGVVTYWLSFLLFVSNSFFERYFRDLTRRLYQAYSGFSWPVIITISLLAGISEELLFRGVIQSWVASHSTVFWGILVSALCFGLVHAISLFYFVFTFAFGCLISVTYFYTESFLFIVAWHAVYDIFSLGIMSKYPRLLRIDESIIEQK